MCTTVVDLPPSMSGDASTAGPRVGGDADRVDHVDHVQG